MASRPRILLAATGSIMAHSFGQLCHDFSGWADVQVIVTKTAAKIIDPRSIPPGLNVYSDGREWARWTITANPGHHIQMCNWADALVIAPLSENTLAKIVGGRMGVNLVTAIITRGWNYGKPFFVAPCMTSLIWSHPVMKYQPGMIGKYIPLQDILPYSIVLAGITPEDISADVKVSLELQLARTGSYRKIMSRF